MSGLTKAFIRLKAHIDRWRLRRIASRRMNELISQWQPRAHAREVTSRLGATPSASRRSRNDRYDAAR
jgi:hypothetical protein